ncbi:MAG: hypothetical protein DRH51_05585 [Candidatus Coatesbacteria bacterium]|nr:MAG: hypothetical protein DRH51_05585 [Candidatus Coatesbacteria bacterium]
MPFNFEKDFEDFLNWNKKFSSLLLPFLKFDNEEEYKEWMRATLSLPNRLDWTVYTKEGKGAKKIAFITLSDYIPELMANLHASCNLKPIKQLLSKKNFEETYIYDVLSRIIKFSFEDLKLKRLGAIFPKKHKFAIDICKKLNFKKEGVLRVVDLIVFSLTEKEFNKIWR